MELTIIEKIIGTGFFTGYAPFAPGTVGSFAALLIYLIPGFENPTIMLLLITAATFATIYLGGKFENKFGKDPSIFTLDEFVGTWLALLMLPKTVIIVIVDFILWRILDILKPFPARQLEKIPGGLGILLDDVISALYALILMNVLLQINLLII